MSNEDVSRKRKRKPESRRRLDGAEDIPLMVVAALEPPVPQAMHSEEALAAGHVYSTERLPERSLDSSLACHNAGHSSGQNLNGIPPPVPIHPGDNGQPMECQESSRGEHISTVVPCSHAEYTGYVHCIYRSS